MAAKPPPAATTILATPINNVEESRTQRLQRQQSRFRDRGGRNTLVDILLGKASPIKKPRRSASLSPSKGRGKSINEKPKSLVRETSVHEQNLTRGSRKRGRSSSVASGGGGSKPVSKVSSHSASKALACKNSPKASSVPANASDKVHGNPPLVKEPSGKKTPALRRTKKPSSSKAKVPKLTQKATKAVENHEENETRPKRTRANAAMSSADPMNGHAKDQKLSGIVTPVASSSKASSAKTRNVKRSAATNLRSSSSNTKASSISAVPSKPSKSKPGAPQLPDIMEEDEDDALQPSRLSAQNQECTKTRHESTTTKKRPVIDEELTDPDERPRKQAKPVRKDATVKQSKAKATKAKATKAKAPLKLSDEEPSPIQRKRRLVVEQDEDMDADGKAGKPAKRKKVVSESEEVENSPLKQKKNVAKPRSKSAPKAQKTTTKKAPTKTAKRKENSVAPQSTQLPPAPVLSRRGPPKSILLRLQNSSAPHVVDDEPDPIDFLS